MGNYPNENTTGGYPPPPQYGQYPPQQGYPQSGPMPPYPQQPMPPGYPQMPPQQPMQPKKKGKGLWIALGVIVGAVVLCAAIGSMASKGNSGTKVDTTGNAGSSTTSNSQPTQPVMQQHFKVGDVVKVGDKWEVTVNSITTSQGGNYITPDPGNVYVLVNVSMKNTSPKEQNTSSLLDWNLKGKDGQRYKDALFSDGDSPPNGKIEAGGPAKGTLSYEVPATVKDFTLSFSPELFESGQTIWDLSV
jgi:U5 snRNP spliceosome subunit